MRSIIMNVRGESFLKQVDNYNTSTKRLETLYAQKHLSKAEENEMRSLDILLRKLYPSLCAEGRAIVTDMIDRFTTIEQKLTEAQQTQISKITLTEREQKRWDAFVPPDDLLDQVKLITLLDKQLLAANAASKQTKGPTEESPEETSRRVVNEDFMRVREILLETTLMTQTLEARILELEQQLEHFGVSPIDQTKHVSSVKANKSSLATVEDELGRITEVIVQAMLANDTRALRINALEVQLENLGQEQGQESKPVSVHYMQEMQQAKSKAAPQSSPPLTPKNKNGPQAA